MTGTTRTAPQQNGAAIREIRKREGLSVDSLAAAVLISGPHMRNIENEHRNASTELLARIAEVLHVPIAALRAVRQDVA